MASDAAAASVDRVAHRNVIDWHGDRSGLSPADLLDLAPESDGIDLRAVRAYRLGRLRQQMDAHQVDVVILSDPINIRYASGARNMQIFSQRNAAARYLIVTADRSILFEFAGCEHLADGLETIDEVRAATTASFVAAGPNIAQRERAWAAEIDAVVDELVGPKATVGLERMNAGAAIALYERGRPVVDAQQPVELARCIKSAEELKCVRASIALTEHGVEQLRDAIEPGVTENELWSLLWQAVVARGGDYCETRLLNSGPRTNPWFQETSHRTIRANELVALDTDVIGCHGYFTDFSRTFHVGPDAPTAEQRRRYRAAYEQVQHNISIIEPGLSFREYANRAWEIPDEFVAHRYYLSAHGNGMSGEYPYLYHRRDFPTAGYDGVIEPDMTLSVESFIGAATGEGVKLEEHLLVTDDGVEVLSKFPFESTLLGDGAEAT